MTNPFRDQEKFMNACDQSTDTFNQDQFKLYLELMKEEWKELNVAIDNNDNVEVLDALLDFIVVTVGALHSLGVDAEGAWKEVICNKATKINPRTGKVNKRSVGALTRNYFFSSRPWHHRR